jgi:hypothetical protein
MKEPIMLENGLKEFRWEALLSLSLNLGYYRHRFIRTVNEQAATQNNLSVERLDQLAKIDDLLRSAGDTLENAKKILFDLCYEAEDNGH